MILLPNTATAFLAKKTNAQFPPKIFKIDFLDKTKTCHSRFSRESIKFKYIVKSYYVYTLASKLNGTLYIEETNNLEWEDLAKNWF